MTKVEGEYDIEAVRAEWIGRKAPVYHGRYPVEYDPIRRYCHMVETTTRCSSIRSTRRRRSGAA